MSKATETVINLMEMEIENELGSVVRGNRNWAIRTEVLGSLKIAYVGRYGAMKRRGLMGARIAAIEKYNIRWYKYTYKKDFEKALKMLENDNYYKIGWVK